MEHVPNTCTIDEKSPLDSEALTAREAFRVVELLSYDSNFVSLVTENGMS